MDKLNLIINNNCKGFIHNGWNNACRVFNSKKGGYIKLDAFFEASLGWMNSENEINKRIKNYSKENFIAIVHNPFNTSLYSKYTGAHSVPVYPSCVIDLISEYCSGLFFMSQHQKTQFHSYYESLEININCDYLYYPMQDIKYKFCIENFIKNKNKKIIQSGMHLRKVSSIVKLSNMLKKEKLSAACIPWEERNQRTFLNEVSNNGNLKLDELLKINKLPHEEYLKLYKNNIFFLDLYDVSACTLVLDCINTHCPILINKLPANIEYLGKNYPFFFNCLEEAYELCNDIDAIYKAHMYLKEMNKSFISLRSFKNRFLKSFVYSNA